jgi:hypothetical protein
MSTTIAKLGVLLIGAHTLLGLSLLAIEATHGVNDQDASFAVAIIFYYLNIPTVWLLRSTSDPPGIALVLVVGIVQWAGVAVLIAVVFHTSRSCLRAIARRRVNATNPSVPGAPDKSIV